MIPPGDREVDQLTPLHWKNAHRSPIQLATV